MAKFFRAGIYILMAILFSFPERHFLSFNIFGIANLNITQFVALLVPAFYFLIATKTSKTPSYVNNIIVIFIVYFFLTSFFKATLISGSLVHMIHEYRISMVFIAAMLIIYMGQKLEPKLFVLAFAAFLLVSFSISLMGLIFGIDLAPRSVRFEDMDYSTFRDGRLINGNKDFAIFAIYFLFTKEELKGFVKPKHLKFLLTVSWISILVAVLNFDRTLIALILLQFMLLTYRNKKNLTQTIAKLILIMGLTFIIGQYFYRSNDYIQRQVDRRILSIVLSENILQRLTFNVWEGNRDYMLTGTFETFLKHPIIGTNFTQPLFYYPDGTPARQTDVTFLNILARNGILGLIIFILIFYRILKTINYRKNTSTGIELYIAKLLSMVIPLFLLYSLNHDTIYRGSLIIVIALLYTFTNQRFKNPKAEETITYSKITFR